MIVTWIIWGSLITENETCWWFTKQNSEALAVMKQVVFHTTLVCPLLLTSRSKNNMCLNVKLFPQYFQWLHCSPFQLGWVKSQWVRVFTLVGMCSHFPFFLKQGKNELTRVSKMIILTKHLNATIDNQRNFKLTFFFLPWGLWMWIWLDILPKPLLQGHQTERERDDQNLTFSSSKTIPLHKFCVTVSNDYCFCSVPVLLPGGKTLPEPTRGTLILFCHLVYCSIYTLD